jgi:hypothetical protein
MNFEEHQKAAAAAPPRPAQKVLEVPPEVWNPVWRRRPTTVTQIGMRLISVEADILMQDNASALATAKYAKFSDDWVTFNNDTIMRYLALESLCEPTDITKQWSGWVQDPTQMHLAEDVVRTAVHRDGLRWFWREYERLRVEVGTLALPADDTTIQGLVDAMCPYSPALKALDPKERMLVLKHFGMNANPSLLTQWMTPSERIIFRRYFGYAVDTFMNALMRGTKFPIDGDVEPLEQDPDEESIAVLGNIVYDALSEAVQQSHDSG